MVLKFPLLYLADTSAWAKLFEAASVEGAEHSHGPVLNRANMFDAAIDGQGIALARTTLAASDLINGGSCEPFAEASRLSKAYWMVCPKATWRHQCPRRPFDHDPYQSGRPTTGCILSAMPPAGRTSGGKSAVCHPFELDQRRQCCTCQYGGGTRRLAMSAEITAPTIQEVCTRYGRVCAVRPVMPADEPLLAEFF